MAALSADGNTAMIGGYSDNSAAGAAWVFTRSNGVWSPQGGKLVGGGAVGAARQGASVALSADGNTALIGGPNDNSGIGAIWAFTRSNGIWSQVSNKLVGSGAVGSARQGQSLAMSADGNTAIVGGYADSSNTGAAWVFTRNAGAWSQLGDKLVGTGASGAAQQGFAVGMAADGKTAAIGGIGGSSPKGSVWVFTFDGAGWKQQGTKLVGSGAAGSPQFGYAVSLSRDGDTLFAGGNTDNSGAGAAWVFSRSDGVWSQLGNKLVGAGASAGTQQGWSTPISADGSTAVSSGISDNNGIGASWVWLRRTPHDFGGNGKSDILWRNTTADVAMWQMNGTTAASVAGLGNIGTSWTPVGQRDFNGDGKSDILWRETSGAVAMWLMQGASAIQVASLGNIGANWNVAGTADFDGDGKGDILWRDTSGNVAMWLMDGVNAASTTSLGNVPTTWSIVGTADFNGDGKSDILWRNTDGTNVIWLMNGASASSVVAIGGVATNWFVAGTADFDGDGKGDILWRNDSGSNAIWLMNGASVSLIGGVGTSWTVASVGDYNGDGKGDILWREAGGSNAIWLMNGTTVSSVSLIGGVATNWSVQNAGAN